MTATTEATTTFTFQPFTRSCRFIWDEGDHVLIGVSPGNSYFSADRIAELVRWASTRFDRVDLVYADRHVARMFAAFGYDEEHAERRASKELKAVRRRIVRGVEEAARPGLPVGVHALSEFAGNQVYDLLHRRVRHFLAIDREFRTGCEEMAAAFLSGKADGTQASPEQLAACLDYIAAELPFFLDTPGILGVPSSVSCYHALIPLTELLYAKGGGLRASRNQAYAVVRPHPVPAEGVAA
ncbi:tRNA-dependent cyclodipeptide synthase [Streptomyces sp. CBMA152]|uniref:tRNA-dependent cyclodipeptide synthase n=1 Tax=Streptomyces sp. CBMA152 TaxID=1896312 RepID=UPI0016610F41|nr:tRNA-dependent cyclodipeptide synthase [Streptomyces sp. CBMA152]MBD0744811.1 tRNA-dependent cyclodipeptide synthase [Streptomyces sp. CBMA152]